MDKHIEVPDPMVVKAEDIKTPKDWHDTLRAASKNTIVMDGAHDHGFMADRIVVTPGITDRKLTPEQITNIIDSPHPPVLNQSMAAQVLSHLHGLGALFGVTPAQAGEVVSLNKGRSVEPGMGLEGATTYNGGPGEVVQFKRSQPISEADKYGKALVMQQITKAHPTSIAGRISAYVKANPAKSEAVADALNHLNKSTLDKGPFYEVIDKFLTEKGF